MSKKQKSYSKELWWYVAVHEAAHAVVGRKLGLRCGKVTLEHEERTRFWRDDHGVFKWAPDGESIAHAELSARWYPRREGDQREADEAYVTALYAGHEAERVICGEAKGNDVHDRENAAKVIGDDPELEAELRARARTVVIAHRADIEMIATALLERRTLFGGEVHVMLAMDRN